MTPSRLRSTVFSVLALGFLGASLFHLAAIVRPTLAEPSPAWRHALFVAINAGVAAGLWRRPRGFAHAFTLLAAQQLYSHGRQGWTVLRDQHRVDWASVLVLVAVPAVTALLWADARGLARKAPG